MFSWQTAGNYSDDYIQLTRKYDISKPAAKFSSLSCQENPHYQSVEGLVYQ